MTSLKKDNLIHSLKSNDSCPVEEFVNWSEEQKERKPETRHEEITENIKMIEDEELIKSESQDDIGGEFSLFPCCKQCENPEKLFVHIKQHHEKDATKCALCGKELSSKSSLDRHLLIHAKWQPYKCSHCNKQFSTNGNMHRHKKTHKGVCKGSKFVKVEHKLDKECRKPKRTLKYGLDLNSNIENKVVISNGIKDLCNGVKRKTNQISQDEVVAKKLKTSAREADENGCGNYTEDKIHLDNKTYPLSPDSQPDVPQQYDDKNCTQNLSIPSSPTKEEFITTLGLKTACRLDTKIESSFVPNSQSDSSIECHKDENIAPEISLSVDGENKLTSQLNLENLIKASTVSSQIQAGQSDMPSKDIPKVPKNVEITFNDLGKHWLPDSPETSTEGQLFQSLLNPEPSHESKGDSLQPQYCCEHCKKVFKNKIIFQKHLMKHNKLKPFKCTICGAKLLSKQNATRHVVKVHKKRRMQAKLLIVENLEDASNVGTKTLCEWCGQEFTSSLILEHHKRASTGCQAKPFICLICNKSFSTKNNGKRHQFKHHKGEKPDCCIVRNVMAKSIENIKSPPKIKDNFSSCASTSTDIAQENSVESILSSKSEQVVESEPSLPKKVLDAAQSLLDMFSSFPRYGSSEDETVNDQSPINSSPVQENNHLYLPSNHVQNKPLDLSVHPMDLSSKSNEHSVKSNDSGFKRLPIISYPKGRNSDTGVFHVNRLTYIASETPLNLVKKKEYNFDNHFNLSHPPLLFSSHSFESNHYSFKETDEPIQKECNSPKPFASYECNLCFMSFSTNSNKRRHEKAKHLMHFKLPQSPKLSFGFFDDKDKQITSTPKSLLSKKTKEALITKVSSLRSELPVDFSISSNSGVSQPLAIISNESENGDLASVSSLINTANSPQLKKYLTADNACDATESSDDTPEVKDDQAIENNVDQTLDVTKTSGKNWCSVCQKQFTCKSSFNRHSVIHTKKRDHHCQECKKTFTTKSNRDRHIKKVHRLILSRDNKKLIPSKKQQKKSITLVPSESSEMEIDVKDTTLPKELVNSEISQCNKENQRFVMPI